MREVNVKFHLRKTTQIHQRNEIETVLKTVPIENESGEMLSPQEFRIFVNEKRKEVLKEAIDKENLKITDDELGNIHCYHITYRAGADVFVYTEEKEFLKTMLDRKVKGMI